MHRVPKANVQLAELKLVLARAQAQVVDRDGDRNDDQRQVRLRVRLRPRDLERMDRARARHQMADQVRDRAEEIVVIWRAVVIHGRAKVAASDQVVAVAELRDLNRENRLIIRLLL